MIKEKWFTGSNIIAAILIMLFLLSFAVVFTLNFRPLYYFDILCLDIPASSGMSEEVIRSNYDALISYNSIFAGDPLEFPTLPMSEGGRVHFAEVKHIFVAIQALMLLSLAGGTTMCVYKLRKKRRAFLKLAAVFSLALPIILGALIAAGWNRFFVAFHRLFFDNDLWIFDSQTDPVITILPDTFFLHCAAMILLLTAIGSAILYGIGRRS
jgi:integral membrane protein (TIGR01906 family)